MDNVIKFGNAISPEECFLEGVQQSAPMNFSHALAIGFSEETGQYWIQMSAPITTRDLAFLVACLQERLGAAMRGEPW